MQFTGLAHGLTVPNSTITLWMCTKSQKDGQNDKNTGIRRAIFHKCPSIDTIGYTACISFSIENLHFLSRNQWLLTTSTIITYLVSPVKKVPNMISHRSNNLHFSHSFVYVCHCYIPRPCWEWAEDSTREMDREKKKSEQKSQLTKMRLDRNKEKKEAARLRRG